MTTTELLALFRLETMDNVVPYFWSDPQIYDYIDAAQKQFCRDTNGIEDSRSFTIDILADGTEWYTYDPRILKLRKAHDPLTGKEYEFIASDKMRGNSMRFDSRQGPLEALITGLEKNTLRAYPKPNTAITLELSTFRLPTTVGVGDAFEIDEQHHRFLLHWVKHLAYSIPDADTFDKRASENYEQKHNAYCLKARGEENRVRRPVSTVTYGGI